MSGEQSRSGGSRRSSGSSRSAAETSEAEEEPILKYARLEGALTGVLAKDSISCVALSKARIVFGTHAGVVHVLRKDGTEEKRVRVHQAAVAAISIDGAGGVVATAGIDGRVVVLNIGRGENSMYDYGRPLRTVSIDPDYSANGKGRFFCGGLAGQAILTERGWMGNRETVLGENEGSIMASAWCGRLVAWSNDKGVRLYDTLNMRLVGFVPKPPDSPRPDLFKCRLLWRDDDCLLIGWFDHLIRVDIHEGVGKVLSLEYEVVMSLDDIVCGLTEFRDDFLVMTYQTDDRENPRRADAERPEIHIVDRTFDVVSEDALGLRGFSRLGPNDYELAHDRAEGVVYVVSPKDVVTARPRTTSDHLAWLLEVERFQDALELARVQELPGELSAQSVAAKYMAHLSEAGDYTAAASLAPEVFVADAERWEAEVFAYAEKDRLAYISPYIPTERPLLSSVVYGMVLGQYLKGDHAMLLDTIRSWPVDIYDDKAIERAMLHRLQSEDTATVREALAELYLKTENPRDAFAQYLRLGKSEAFDLVEQYNLFDAVQQDVLRLVQLGVETTKSDDPWDLVNARAIELLVTHPIAIEPQKVVDQLSGHEALLFCYLRDAAERDPELIAPHIDLVLQLFAEYDREKLFEVLRGEVDYSLQSAVDICEKHDFVPELVYLLGKTGDNKRALHLIIERLGDVSQAIAFAMAQHDEELWEDLISYALDKPPFIRGLFEQAGAVVDPVKLLRRIPEGTPLAGLKNSLSKVFSDFDLQLSLSQCGIQIHGSELSVLTRRLLARQRRGVLVQPLAYDAFVLHDGGILRRDAIDTTWQYREPRLRGHSVAEKITDCAIHRDKVLLARASPAR